MTDSVMKWYVVRAIGGQENKVKSYIETSKTRNSQDETTFNYIKDRQFAPKGTRPSNN